MSMMDLPIFRIVLGDCDGLTKMSLVESPAVDSEFIAFSKQEEQEFRFSIDKTKHNIFGVALRADYPIYRESGRMRYFVVFEKDTINQLYEKFMKDGLTSKVNLEHSKDTDGVYLIQSFLKDTEHGINPVGFEDISDGSWFVSYHIDNQAVWDDILAGKFNGFSVECFAEIDMMEEKDELEEFIDELLK